MTPERSPLAHALPLAAVFVLLLNDHFLKAHYPGLVTGKLSDIAGLLFFPLFLVALMELTGRFGAPRWLAMSSVVLTGLVFALVKTTSQGQWVYEWGLGLLQWPFRALGSLARYGSFAPLQKVMLVRDATDLLALPVLVVPARMLWRRSE